ncbi:Uncharacterized protein PECH_003636 [Penicillium ucsense]|uniref:G-patch domain-containing protein n=1 Tax=Penicillium ucsense TaxID=2839758 RepID=A0A8J8W7Y1_9EURO|nr:Uncharacterized protein PECM_001863 [Penicillium ucsense]KAF7737465.1 Uncharacterized protein PECH_003636 [Penicillium ucsense]
MSLAQRHDDEDYYLPLQDQRVFGAGVRRKRVPFVRSSEHELSTIKSGGQSSTTPLGPSIADKYLSIVLQKEPIKTTTTSPTAKATSDPVRAVHSAQPNPDPTGSSSTATLPTPSTLQPSAAEYCEICNLPLSVENRPENQRSATTSSSRPHEASLAHQVCLEHSHPPSHLDRTRAGLRYLSNYGWDPDSRLGLGATGREGIREPLKGRMKTDTAGLGAGRDADGDLVPTPPPRPKKVEKLNAKQARKSALEAQKRGDKLRNMFFQSDQVLKYLGEDV